MVRETIAHFPMYLAGSATVHNSCKREQNAICNLMVLPFCRWQLDQFSLQQFLFASLLGHLLELFKRDLPDRRGRHTLLFYGATTSVAEDCEGTPPTLTTTGTAFPGVT